MLAYILALAVGLGSLVIYIAAFFFPEIHRKNDFIWSGIGLFYAWVLWVCAGQITGGLLLGQVAGVALLGWSVTQTLQLRRQLTPRQQQTELPSAEAVKNTVQEKVANLSIPERLSQLGKRLSSSTTGAKDQTQQKLSATTQRRSQSNVAASTSVPSSATNTPTPQADEVKVLDDRTSTPEPSADLTTTEIQPALTEEEGREQGVEGQGTGDRGQGRE